ncbi:MAG: rod shape-determining protein RodA [Thermotaleaceae bacterium]
MFKFDTRLLRKIDFGLIAIVILICILGVVIIGSATQSLESSRYIRTQIVSILMGFAAIIVIMCIDYNTLAKLYIPIYVFCNGLLMAVLIFGAGKDSWGANRWIRIGGHQFQPSDFVKIGIIICLAKIAADKKETIDQLPTLLKVVGFVSVPMLLILVQPDLGTTLTFAAFTFGILFVAGIRYKHILITGLVGILSMPFAWLSLKDYQKTRILVFLNPEMDPMGKGYHVLQSKLTIGSGRLFGRGLFKGVQNQLGFLPEKHTDFIFSVLSEELGFLGAGILLVLYMLLLVKCINIARKAKDDFGTYLVTGVTFMLAFHIFANIAMTIGLMPVTGKPLPFVSYGGTFMLSNMIALGLVLNVNMRRDKINF